VHYLCTKFRVQELREVNNSIKVAEKIFPVVLVLSRLLTKIIKIFTVTILNIPQNTQLPISTIKITTSQQRPYFNG